MGHLANVDIPRFLIDLEGGHITFADGSNCTLIAMLAQISQTVRYQDSPKPLTSI